MSKLTQDIANLLAHRDGEPVPAGIEIAAEDLQAVQDLKQGLRNMADVPVAEELWLKKKPPRWHQYPLSTAASVLLLSATLVFGLVSGVGRILPGEGASIASVAPSSDSGLLALMDRSQDLERIAYDTRAWQQSPPIKAAPALAVSPLGEFILYQLAEVDEAIAQDNLDQELTAQLWQQRVNLLQAFLAEMESENPGKFENKRSM